MCRRRLLALGVNLQPAAGQGINIEEETVLPQWSRYSSQSNNIMKYTVAAIAVLVAGIAWAQDEDLGNGLPAGSEDILSAPYDPNAFSCEGQDYGYYADVASGCEVLKK